MRRFIPVPQDTTCRGCGKEINATTPEDAASYHRESRVTFDEAYGVVFADYCSNGCINAHAETLAQELYAYEAAWDEALVENERWVTDDMGRDVDTAIYAGYPAAYPTQFGGVTEGHVAYCATHGHATHQIDGVVQPHCPRCGEVTESARGRVALVESVAAVMRELTLDVPTPTGAMDVEATYRSRQRAASNLGKLLSSAVDDHESRRARLTMDAAHVAFRDYPGLFDSFRQGWHLARLARRG
jgi:predicted RNA-binding Zn-ribbon protein involved in translation (DUF1610 family)